MKSLLNIRYLIDGTTESEVFEQHKTYQLIPPYQLILNEEKRTKNGTSIFNKTEKKGDFYFSYYSDGRIVKIDTLFEFQYSLKEYWAQYLFDIDSCCWQFLLASIHFQWQQQSHPWCRLCL